MITRWDPDRREMENLPDQPEMLDLMLMKNLGLSKVGWFTLKLAENHSVILLRHVTSDRVSTLSNFKHCDSFLEFQDLNNLIDQLDKEKIVYFDEDLMSRTLFIVSSKR